MENEKPWYMSTGIWAGVAVVAMSVSGVKIDQDTFQTINDNLGQLITGVAGVIAIYGRARASSGISTEEIIPRRRRRHRRRDEDDYYEEGEGTPSDYYPPAPRLPAPVNVPEMTCQVCGRALGGGNTTGSPYISGAPLSDNTAG